MCNSGRSAILSKGCHGYNPLPPHAFPDCAVGIRMCALGIVWIALQVFIGTSTLRGPHLAFVFGARISFAKWASVGRDANQCAVGIALQVSRFGNSGRGCATAVGVQLFLRDDSSPAPHTVPDCAVDIHMCALGIVWIALQVFYWHFDIARSTFGVRFWCAHFVCEVGLCRARCKSMCGGHCIASIQIR